MSILSLIAESLGAVIGGAYSTVVEALRTVVEGNPATRREVAFSVAIIALSAKMAKADGIVTEDEVSAFRELFDIPDREANNVARIYNLAKKDVSGYDAYARQVRGLFDAGDPVLADVLDGLFHIAKADGLIHENEMLFLEDVASLFGIEGRDFECVKLRHLQPPEGDPYLLLKADRGWDNETLKKHYRQLVRENHPDAMIARGVPKEFLNIANERLAAINLAWDRVRRERGI